jgi:uncharacterized membrane protein (UPF0182 family)
MERLPGRRRKPPRLAILIGLLVLLLISARTICSVILDYQWWSEMGQVPVWLRIGYFRYLTGFAEWLIVFAILWIAHARGMKYADTGLREHPMYARGATVALLAISGFIAAASMSGWVLARYWAGSGLETAWQDPVFGHPLSFYFFDLPFYNQLVGFVEVCALAGALVYYLAARIWQIQRSFPEIGQVHELSWDLLKTLGKLETWFLQVLLAGFLVALAVNLWLGRYEMLYSDHGNLLVGIDWVEQHISLPLQTAKAGAALLAAVLVLARRRRLALGCLVVLLGDFVAAPLVSSLYVRPNELMLEKPYMERHIEATRTAFGLDKSRDLPFAAHGEGKIDFARNEPLLSNVRLWDYRAFNATLSQSQPLRPYAYANTDVDRYSINGQMRQVLLAPRELDLNQLGDAGRRWINSDLTFTHGYGLVLAQANRITTAGLPELLIHDAPVQVLTPSLKLTRPEIYYGEASHEPVYVHTAQQEFNYPSDRGEVNTSYSGTGGFPIASPPLRLAAAIQQGEWNIALSGSLGPEARMMIRRKIPERLAELAEFISWDGDPYLVITDDGHLSWIVDGYTTSTAFPYARAVSDSDGAGEYNYIRNSVKATIDAYDGDVHMYVFDPQDPLIRAYQRLFPSLFTPASQMPAGLRAHTRAPEVLFRTQAEIYRTYHMRDPELYYNRADMWDLATYTTGQGGSAQAVPPTYMVATLPGETKPEFLLTTPFTPRNKQNLIGMMVTRCDGDHLGEVIFLQLPKQEIIRGPLQIDALINQDQVISKDLTLWNQQGSQVVRPQILTLPIDNTFLYVAPIFIQAAEARMPQLRKVALAVGSTLVYQDTYEQALEALQSIQRGRPVTTTPETSTVSTTAAPAPAKPAATGSDSRIEAIRGHMQKYRELSAQGRWSEAGKELEAIEASIK